MTSPTKRSKQQPKRASKPFIPALPILPRKKTADQTRAPEAEPGVPRLLGSIKTCDNVEELVAKDPSPTAHAASPAKDNSALTAATEAPNTADNGIAGTVVEKVFGQDTTPIDPAFAATAASDESELGVPDAVRSDYGLPDSLTSTDMSQQYDTDPSRTGLSTSSSVTSQIAPLVIDSSVAKGPFGPQSASSMNDTTTMNANDSYMFQALGDSSEPSPARAASVENTGETLTVASSTGPSYPQEGLQAHSHWPAGHQIQSESVTVPMPPPQAIPSTFSPSAAVFTPANSTPPYSQSNTPALIGPPAFTESNAEATHGLDARNPMTPSNNQGSNEYNASFESGASRNPNPVQSLSHAHGEQKTPHVAPNYAQRNPHSHSRSRGSTGTEGLFVPLVTHLTTLYDHGSMSDWTIIISSPEDAFRPLFLAVHGAIICRNPVLYAYMQQAPRNKKEAHIKWMDTYIHPSSFSYAVRYLYNEECPTKEEVELMSNPGIHGPSPRHLQLHWALSYYISGFMLNLAPVLKHGRDLVKAFLDWDLIETAMHWAIDYRPKVFHEMTDSMSNAMSRTPSAHSNFSEQTSSSRSKLIMPYSDAFRLKTLDNGAPLVISQPVSDLLLEQVIFFLAYRVPFESFVLDPTARASEMRSRLPLTKEIAAGSRLARNSALQGMSFGEFSTGPRLDPFGPEFQNYVASVAFLNLPFDQIKGLLMLLQRRADPRALEFAKQVIADRENLRNQVIRSKSVSAHERDHNLVDWYEAGFREVISMQPTASRIDGYPAEQGFRLDRCWQGLRNPATITTGNTHPGPRKRYSNKKRDLSYPEKPHEQNEPHLPSGQYATSNQGNSQAHIE